MNLKNLSILAMASMMILTACKDAKQKPNNNEDENKEYRELAKEAYVYAFPAVEHNKGLWSILKGFNTPTNHFIANTNLFTHENTTVVSPNNDTFYSYAVCDIRYEPVIITVPLIEERYFSIQLCDMFTNCPDYISTLATGEGPGNYLIARSDWDDTPPAGIDKVIKYRLRSFSPLPAHRFSDRTTLKRPPYLKATKPHRSVNSSELSHRRVTPSLGLMRTMTLKQEGLRVSSERSMAWFSTKFWITPTKP